MKRKTNTRFLKFGHPSYYTYDEMKKIRCTSIFTMPVKILLRSHTLDDLDNKEFWKVKYLQSINIEKNRVIIDDHEYLINPIDGFLAEINKEMINNV